MRAVAVDDAGEILDHANARRSQRLGLHRRVEETADTRLQIKELSFKLAIRSISLTPDLTAV